MTSGERISRPYVGLVRERQCSSVNWVTREGQHIPEWVLPRPCTDEKRLPVTWTNIPFKETNNLVGFIYNFLRFGVPG